MKNVKMLCVVALFVGISQVARAHEGSHDGSHSGQKGSERDQLRAAVQEICPVSGGKLGSMGTPIKVQIGKESVFLCCKGCMKGKVNPKHWATIHANIASAQGKCPVMNKAVTKDSKWTIVNGQIIYTCCPPCGDKIAANPETYLKKVDQQYAD